MGKDSKASQHEKNDGGEEVNWAVVGPILAVAAAIIIALFFL